MQEAELPLQIANTQHSKNNLCHDLLVPDNTYKKCSFEDGPQYFSRLQTFCTEYKTEIQKLQKEYLTNIRKLHTEIESWKQTSEAMKSYAEEIKSSLHNLKVILTGTVLNFL
jgi:hypothetical protein